MLLVTLIADGAHASCGRSACPFRMSIPSVRDERVLRPQLAYAPYVTGVRSVRNRRALRL